MLVSERLQVPLCALPSAVVSGFSPCFVKKQFPRRQGGTWGAAASPQGLMLWSLLGHPTVAGCPDSLPGPLWPQLPHGRMGCVPGAGSGCPPLSPHRHESSAGLCVVFPHLVCSGDGAFRVHLSRLISHSEASQKEQICLDLFTATNFYIN